MRMHRILLAALAFAVAAPAVTEAQLVYRTARRGMLGFASELHVGGDGQLRRVVVDVVKESPAATAGVAVGDTLIRFNGLQPSNELLNAFSPGDTVVLRLRRNGRERDVRVVAGERSNTFDMTFMSVPDSIRNRIAITVDAIRADMDTVRFPRLRIEKLQGDSAVVFLGPDRVFAFGGGTHQIQLDSIRALMMKGGEELRRAFGDSTRVRIWTDSTGGGAFMRSYRFPHDSAGMEIFAVRPRAGTLMRDSLFTFRPSEMIASNLVVGMRAIAGAELFELNPALGETFGTLEGVLVLNAPEGTPAARAGLRGGDVIVNADGEAVTTISSLRQVIQRKRAGSAVRLEVLRRGQRVTVDLNRQ